MGHESIARMTDGTAETAVDLPTTFEESISHKADEILALGRTGYNWTDVDLLLKSELVDDVGFELATRCKHAQNSGRAANVLTESMDKDIDLYLVFVSAPYTVAQFVRAAKKRISRFPKVRTVIVAERVEGAWRVTTAIHRADDDLADRIQGHFPLLASENIHTVTELPTDGQAANTTIGHIDEDELLGRALATPTELAGLADLPAALSAYAAANGVALDISTATDVLACALSSQFLLFAGPSGTGKSTVARLLAAFLSRDEAIAVLEARSGWSGPEDAFGYYSSLTSQFAQTPDTPRLVALHEFTASSLSGEHPDPDHAASPVLLVEEANLSPIEGYLSPVTHGLSSVSVPMVTWPLHAQREGAADSDELLEVPPTAALGPWPRVFATINVDANSIAPARKVTARAAVVLLEPEDSWDPAAEAARILSSGTSGADAGKGPSDSDASPAHTASSDAGKAPVRALGDPTAARGALDVGQLIPVLEHFGRLLQVIGDASPLVPSRRDTERAANYMAYFLALAGNTAADDVSKVAAENAIVHVVLSQLPTHAFAAAIERLAEDSQLTKPAEAGGLGGGLGRRVGRLRAATTGMLFTDSMDFWAALS
jgi:energy-coupling factor transporter ATP-binding protein EcfA2